MQAGYEQTARFPVYNRPFVAEPSDIPAQWVVQFQNPFNYNCIDVLESHTSSIADVLDRFHSTIVMNAISAHHVLVMFPQSTLKLVALAKTGEVTAAVASKYAARGVQFVYNNTSDIRPCGFGCPNLVRSVGREGTVLYAPLSLDYLRVPPIEFPYWRTWSAPFVCQNAACANCVKTVRKLFLIRLVRSKPPAL